MSNDDGTDRGILRMIFYPSFRQYRADIPRPVQDAAYWSIRRAVRRRELLRTVEAATRRLAHDWNGCD
ncbi:MAG: hypothetical protein P4L84_24540 [Isosphaeraceae bacterium]|nr:hypothetical protein [Isosphaeraceae bacterium]